MATNNKLDKFGLGKVWDKIVANFVAKEAGKGLSTNDFDNAAKTKLEGVEAGAQVNVIESVKVNGVAQTVTEKGIDISVPTGALASKDEVSTDDLSEALAAEIAKIEGKADKATTLAGYAIDNAYTKGEVDEQINGIKSDIASVYKVKGSIAFAELPTADITEGDVYNITDDFTVTEDFVEFDGDAEKQKAYPAGTNVVYTENGWDALAGTYDFSGFLMKTDLVDITEEEINAICVMPE